MAATLPAGGLAEITQDTFGRGMVQNGARTNIPPDAAFELTNVFLDDRGNPNRRAGSAYLSNAAFDGLNPTRMLWSGFFNAGARTVFMSSNAKLGVLAADDATPVTINSSAFSSVTGTPAPVKVGDLLVIPGPTPFFLYGGSRKGADYSTGTVTATSGSRVVTGSGTSWTTNADAGMLVSIAGDGQTYIIQSVDSATQVTLNKVWAAGTGSGKTYTFARGSTVSPSNTLIPVTGSPKIASVANRLAFLTGNQCGLSDIQNPFAFSAGNFLSFGGTGIGLANVRETLLVFTTGGMYAVGGLANATPSDATGGAQWSYQLANPELIAWSHEGIASWNGKAVVPALDGVWLVDPTSGPRRISDNIRDLYLGYVRTSGLTTGTAAVHSNHYFLPVLDSSSSYAWVDTLVCRLDTGAWTRFAGSGAKMNAFASRRTSPTVLLGSDSLASSRVMSLSYFQPSAALRNDHDGSSPTVTITTRDFEDSGRDTLWARVRALFVGSANLLDTVTVRMAYLRPEDVNHSLPSSDTPHTLTGSPQGQGLDVTDIPATGNAATYGFWNVGKRGKAIRFTITTAGALQDWVLYKLTVFFNQSGGQ